MNLMVGHYRRLLGGFLLDLGRGENSGSGGFRRRRGGRWRGSLAVPLLAGYEQRSEQQQEAKHRQDVAWHDSGFLAAIDVWLENK
jgi:hypothetical protein